ncbi:MAG TPA: O-methyltransferase [Solirubrobacterales bacterium]|nr:O-methyltransferase [Solirubrobacterales bacterium]
MAIFTDHVIRYMQDVRPERSQVMADMERFAETDHVPIVHWETGRFLATLVRATDPAQVLEVGTAIGYSTLHMAQELGRGKIVTIERDPDRVKQATDYLERAGVKDRVEIVQADATEALERLPGPFDLIFLDGTKTEYQRYFEMAEPKASERAVLVVDNMLMSGDVALEDDSDAFWSAENLASAREFNAKLLRSEQWLGAVLPIGDGVVFAARR